MTVFFCNCKLQHCCLVSLSSAILELFHSSWTIHVVISKNLNIISFCFRSTYHSKPYTTRENSKIITHWVLLLERQSRIHRIDVINIFLIASNFLFLGRGQSYGHFLRKKRKNTTQMQIAIQKKILKYTISQSSFTN